MRRVKSRKEKVEALILLGKRKRRRKILKISNQ